jgi:peptidoglycan/xylan/chitin deacetylase (PgdA/CDA1 family)
MNLIKSFLFKILDISYFFTKWWHKFLIINKNPRIRVLIYHDIKTEEQIQLFKKQILSLQKEYEFISPIDFQKDLINNKNNKTKILLSFDDGFKSNRKLAEEVLNKLNIKALFFIISDFVGAKKQTEKYKKIIHNIYPNGPSKSEFSDPMDHDDIKFLISSGHQIGCHTQSHQMLSKISSSNELNEELVFSKNKLEKDFDIKIKHFAFPFGTFDSINLNSLKILDKNYQFIHSGLRGNNKKTTKLIYRDAVNPEMTINRFKVFLIGNADFLYKRKFKKLNGYLN